MDEHQKPRPQAKHMTLAEKEAAERFQLYMVHKRRGTLGTYYQMFPDERPGSRLPHPFEGRIDEGHERER